MFFTKIRPVYFFAAFAVGLLMCYLISPTPEVVVKFPSPYNSGQVVYNDKAHGCFKINANSVECPKDAATVKPQPVTEDFRQRRF